MEFKKSIYGKIILFIVIVFLGKIVVSTYQLVYSVPEAIQEMIQKNKNNFIIFQIHSLPDWKKEIKNRPISMQKQLEGSLFWEEYIYEFSHDHHILSKISSLQLEPITYSIKTHIEEPRVQIRVIFYKRIFNFPILIHLISESVLWSLFLTFSIIVGLGVIYIGIYIFFSSKKMIGQYLSRNIEILPAKKN